MDVQLQELVEKIKKDGVESAEARAAEIIRAAEDQAAAVLKKARDEAEAIITQGKAEASRSEKAGVDAIRQAARNLLIAFRDGLTAELDALVKAETVRAYDAELLKTVIPAVVQGWASSGSESIDVLLGEKNAAALSSNLQAALKAELASGLTIRSDSGLEGGFRIGTRDGAAYYDFSADSVAELFSAYLNPKVAGILKSAAKEL